MTASSPSGATIPVDAPPALETDEGAAGVLAGALPMLGSLGSVALLATMATQSGASGHRSLLAAGAFLLGTLAFVVVQIDRQRARRSSRRCAARRRYLRHLADVRARAGRAAAEQRRVQEGHHPPPSALPHLLALGHIPARARDDPQRLVVRYGVGDRPAAVPLEPVPASSSDDPDPAALDALHRLLAAHHRVADLPLTLDLSRPGRVLVEGDLPAARSLVRALVAQAVACHPPDLLAVAVTADDRSVLDWDWLKWLPHLTAPDEVASAPADGRHLLLVVDGDRRAPGGAGDVTVLHVGGGARAEVRITVGADGAVTTASDGGESVTGRADTCDVATADALARRLLARRPRPDGAGDSAATDVPTLLGIPDPRAIEPADVWQAGPGPPRLSTPVGITETGTPVHLDLEESARGGVGPHGLVVGATGSGKSELLRTLVLGLALSHPPDRLNLVLVDFKGGATFAGLARLPHVAACVTNLADDLSLVDRMQDALGGELVRRQEALRSAGLASVLDPGHGPEPSTGLPRLLVVVDEFAEMLTARPELLETFQAIGRLGRSLGVHLLLASQRLEEGRLRGLESHLSYRIGLRTFSATESRAVLGVPDAAELPPLPGAGYLRTGPGTPVRFRAAYVSGPVDAASSPDPCPVVPFALGGPTRPPASSPAPSAGVPSVLDVVIDRLAGHGAPACAVWVPPLDQPDTLGDLVGMLVRDPRLGLVATDRRPHPLLIPLGVVDRPREQRRDPLVVDLSGAAGHVAVVGSPRSGRTTVLQTLVCALALTHTPREAQALVLDLAGGGLAPLGRLPHVAAVASRGEPDVVRRVVAHVSGLLDHREVWWRDHGVSDVAAYRRLLRDGGEGDGHGEVFLVVDGWSELRADHDDLEAALQRLASRGLALGVHLVVATGRWGDLRAATRDLLGARVELRLGDPLDSEVDRRAARGVPVGRPGRGLTGTGHHVLTALPRLDGVGEPASAAAGLDDLLGSICAAWPGPPAPRVGRLPTEVRLDDVRALAEGADCLLLGADDRRAIGLDPAAEPLLLVLGDRASGRTTSLRTLLGEVVRTRTPTRAQLVVLDPRRGLLDVVPSDQLLGHHVSATSAAPALRELAEHLRGRLPGPDVTADQLRARTWWTGAELHVVVDDHELLVAGGRSPLEPLLPLLPHAADVGLRLVVARRTAGAARALHEPDLRALRDLAAPTLLLPGNPDEGPLVGRLGPLPGPPGRARLVTASGDVTELQVAR